MAFNVSEADSKPRELIPTGTILARCYRFIVLGTSIDPTFGKEQTKIMFGFEFPTKKKVWKEGEPAKSLVKDIEFTATLGEKSNLRAFIESWRGKPFTKEELRSFDIASLIGQTGIANIIHDQGKKDPTKMYDKIKSIIPLMEGQECPEQIMPSFEFNFTDKYSETTLEDMPDFLKNKIKESNEYKAIIRMEEEKRAKEEKENPLPF